MGKEAFRPSSARFRGGAKTYWASYSKLHRYRGNVRKKRTYYKKFYVSGRVKSIGHTINRYKNKQGGITIGIKIVYDNHVAAFTAKRGNTTYKQPKKTVEVTKIVPITGGRIGQRVTIYTKKPAGAMSV